MTNHEKVKAAQTIHEVARQYRGRFLNYVACIEHDLAHILADYFCPNSDARREVLYEEILTSGSFSLNHKKKVFLKIVKRDYPRYWDNNEQILSAFDQIQTFRNRLAHSKIDVSDIALMRPLNEGIGFTDWNDGKPITEQEFDDFCVKANMIGTCLIEIRRLLPFIEKKK